MTDVVDLDSRRPGTKTAYLVVHMDTASNPPRILGAHIYGESARTLTCAIGRGVFAFDVVEHEAHDFETARRGIIDMAEPYRSVFKWALELLPEGT